MSPPIHERLFVLGKQQAEYEVLTAYSGEEALQKLAAQTDTLQLVAVPVAAIGEAALVSVAACLLATAIPLRKISRMSIVEAIEGVE